MVKRRISVLVALLLAAPVGVVALERASTAETEAAEAVEAVTETEATEAAAEAAPAEPVAEATEPAPEQQAAAETVRLPFTNIEIAVSSDTFPMGSTVDYRYEPLPSQAQYFAQLERERAHLVARGDAFPVSDGDNPIVLLPSQVAYFERLEQERTAVASASQPVAPEQVQAPAASTVTAPAADPAVTAPAETAASPAAAAPAEVALSDTVQPESAAIR